MPNFVSMAGLLNRRVVLGTGALVVGTWLGRRMLARQAQGGISPERRRSADPEQIEAMIQRWRDAVASRDFQKMRMIQQAFLMDFDRYLPRLEQLALSDPDERVREVSTSVLGRFGSARQAPIFEALLEDESLRVRKNAAFALRRLGRTVPSARSEPRTAATTASPAP